PGAAGDVRRPGTLFANLFEVKDLLGMGGMGVVYRAFDRELQEAVAIKTLRKPQNIVVEPSGVLKVMDFGIARLANRSKDEGLTRKGMSIGTPDYMSPEQLAGKELDARSDLYSVGVVLFECLTRRLRSEEHTSEL